MSLDWIKNLVFFAVLLLAQALVLNYVHLFNCATPLLYVYFVLPTRRNQPRWITLVSCFLNDDIANAETCMTRHIIKISLVGTVAIPVEIAKIAAATDGAADV